MGERFAARGCRSCSPTCSRSRSTSTVAELRAAGLDVTGVVTDVTDWDSVERAARRDPRGLRRGPRRVQQRRHRRRCRGRDVGARAQRLEMGDRASTRVGVVHGINAFVPVMLAQGDEGHVVNTSSGNGGVSPLPSTPQYAVTKAAVVTHQRMPVRPAARGRRRPDRRSVLFPGPHMLRTGLFESWRVAYRRVRQGTPTPDAVHHRRSARSADEGGGDRDRRTPRSRTSPSGSSTASWPTQFWIHPESERTDAAAHRPLPTRCSTAPTPPTYGSVPGEHIATSAPTDPVPDRLRRQPCRAADRGLPQLPRVEVPPAVR